MKTMLSVREAAVRMGCTLRYIYDLLHAAKLPGAEKRGKTWRIPAAGVEARLKAREANDGTAGR